MSLEKQEGTIPSEDVTEEVVTDEETSAVVDEELSNILSESEESTPKTPIEKEVDKYMNKFENEESGGLDPEGLKAELIRAGFMKVENNRITRGSTPDSGMVLEAYKRATAARREKIDSEAAKCLSTLEKYNGNKSFLEDALIKQGIVRKSKEGEVLPQKGMSLEYKGYLSALKQYEEKQ